MTTCDRCGYEWDYSGDLGTTTCPNCNRKTSTGKDFDKLSLDPVGGVGECWICGDGDVEYHHVSYDRDVVVPLCENHHEEAHGYEEHPLYPVDSPDGHWIKAVFSEGEHDALTELKGDRTWREAILEEFGVATGGD